MDIKYDLTSTVMNFMVWIISMGMSASIVVYLILSRKTTKRERGFFLHLAFSLALYSYLQWRWIFIGFEDSPFYEKAWSFAEIMIRIDLAIIFFRNIFTRRGCK
jgi:hypothetical protein